MAIEKKAFVSYDVKEKDTNRIVVRLNEDEMKLLNEVMFILKQSKPTTAFKQCFKYGAKGILSPSTAELLTIVHSNKRKNERTGIAEFD